MFIQYNFTKLIKNLLFTVCLLTTFSCNEKPHYTKYPQVFLILPSGEKIETYLAINAEEQTLGLSHIKDNEFNGKQGMLFFNQEDSIKHFWMPNTHFNLDIIFLNKDLYVLDIHKNIKHFPNSGPDHLIPRSKPVYARHVLEIRADSPLSEKIQPGMILKWEGEPNLLQKE